MPTIKQLDGVITGVDGMPVISNNVPLTVKRALTQVISVGSSADPVQAMELAHTLFHTKDGSIELSDEQWKSIQELIANDKSFVNVIRAALITFSKEAVPKKDGG